MRVAVLGAGNGGQALAASIASRGHEVRLFNRSSTRLHGIRTGTPLYCFGAETACGTPALVTSSIDEAIAGVDLILVSVTADAHGALAHAMAGSLKPGQTILLMPGRTGGALEVREVLRSRGVPDEVRVAETQSLIYACRCEEPGRVRIIGVKQHVPLAAFPARDTAYVLTLARELYPCFVPARHVLETSLENVGAVLHPALALLNASALERGELFYFYQDLTERVAGFLEALDAERLMLAAAYGLAALKLTEWIKRAYPATPGNRLSELMRANPAYHEIRAPASLDSRMLTEDVPTGLVPFLGLGDAVGVDMPITRSLVTLASSLLGHDYAKEGRTLARMGLKGMNGEAILAAVS